MGSQALYSQHNHIENHENRQDSEVPSSHSSDSRDQPSRVLESSTDTSSSTFHELPRDCYDDSLCDSCYPYDFSALFTFFSKPHLWLHVELNQFRPVPSLWHDKGKRSHVIYARIGNQGKTAHSLEASIAVSDVGPNNESLYWNMPTHDPNPPLTLERLPKGGFATLAIAYIIPEEHVWKFETAESGFLPNPHIVHDENEHMVALKVTYEPSRVDTWFFGLRLYSTGKTDINDVEKVNF